MTNRPGMLTSSVLAAAADAAGLADASLVVRPLDGRASVEFEATMPLYPASMIKTPLAMVAFRDIEAGRLTLAGRHAVEASNMTANDAPSPLVPGYRATLEEIIELAITVSDNVATNMLFDILGRERATDIARDEFGLTQTGFYRKLSGSDPLIADAGWTSGIRNTFPAIDAARAFELMAHGDIPGADALRAVHARQHYNEKLSVGLHDDDRFAHKTGDTDEVTHDGGILITSEGRSYVVIAYVGMPSTDENAARFGPYMQRIRALL